VLDAFKEDIDPLLIRIGLEPAEIKQADRDLNLLRRLVKSFQFAIPFETVDVHVERRIQADLKQIHAKVVTRNRGGLCFEIGLLLGWLAYRLGYKLRFYYANVSIRRPESKSHLAFSAEVDGKHYYCDAGLGSGVLSPLEIDTEMPEGEGETQTDLVDGYKYRFVKSDEGDGMHQIRLERQSVGFIGFQGVINEPGTWEPVVFFSVPLNSALGSAVDVYGNFIPGLDHVSQGIEFVQTSPLSWFNRNCDKHKVTKGSSSTAMPCPHYLLLC